MFKSLRRGAVAAPAFVLLFVISAFAAPLGVLPDPALTPGAVDPAVTQENIMQTICVHGYSAKHRHVTTEEKKEALAKYRAAYKRWPRGPYEFDHLISLEIGGVNDIDNLWPEPLRLAKKKDQAEDYLHRLVCSDKILLKDAQESIKNWPAVYEEMKHGRR